MKSDFYNSLNYMCRILEDDNINVNFNINDGSIILSNDGVIILTVKYENFLVYRTMYEPYDYPLLYDKVKEFVFNLKH